MKNSHLLEIFSVLNDKEVKEFYDFLSSPFFNKNKSVIALFEYLRKYYPEFPEEKVNKERVYNRIFAGTKYSDNFMRKTMFTLSQLAEEYLSYKGFKSNKREYQNTLLKEYYDRNNPSLFASTYKAITSQSSQNSLNIGEYYYSYLSSYRNLSFGAEHKSVDFTKFAFKNDLFEPLEFLSAFYYSSIMNLYEYYLNTQRMLKLEIDNEYFESIIRSFDKKIVNKYPLVKIHFNLIKMLTEPDKEDYYLETKQLFAENEKKLDELELGNININLQNYCMRKIRANKPGYTKELFDIYKMELENSSYSSEIKISVVLYRNIIFTSLQLGETIFAEEFAEKYRLALSREVRDQNYNYSKAHIYLKNKDYEKTGVYLSRIKSMDELLKADVKTMYVQIYLETGAIEQLHALIDTFRHFVRTNQKLSDERKSIYNTFINFSSRLMGLKEKYDDLKKVKLKEDIENGENIINKGWLLEKIAELKK